VCLDFQTIELRRPHRKEHLWQNTLSTIAWLVSPIDVSSGEYIACHSAMFSTPTTHHGRNDCVLNEKESVALTQLRELVNEFPWRFALNSVSKAD
jgi:hypothetical protein